MLFSCFFISRFHSWIIFMGYISDFINLNFPSSYIKLIEVIDVLSRSNKTNCNGRSLIVSKLSCLFNFNPLSSVKCLKYFNK